MEVGCLCLRIYDFYWWADYFYFLFLINNAHFYWTALSVLTLILKKHVSVHVCLSMCSCLSILSSCCWKGETRTVNSNGCKTKTTNWKMLNCSVELFLIGSQYDICNQLFYSLIRLVTWGETTFLEPLKQDYISQNTSGLLSTWVSNFCCDFYKVT